MRDNRQDYNQRVPMVDPKNEKKIIIQQQPQQQQQQQLPVRREIRNDNIISPIRTVPDKKLGGNRGRQG